MNGAKREMVTQELTLYHVKWTDDLGNEHTTGIYGTSAEDASTLISEFYLDSSIQGVSR